MLCAEAPRHSTVPLCTKRRTFGLWRYCGKELRVSCLIAKSFSFFHKYIAIWPVRSRKRETFMINLKRVNCTVALFDVVCKSISLSETTAKIKTVGLLSANCFCALFEKTWEKIEKILLFNQFHGTIWFERQPRFNNISQWWCYTMHSQLCKHVTLALSPYRWSEGFDASDLLIPSTTFVGVFLYQNQCCYTIPGEISPLHPSRHILPVLQPLLFISSPAEMSQLAQLWFL